MLLFHSISCMSDHVMVYSAQLGHEYHYRQDVMTFYIHVYYVEFQSFLTSFSPSPSLLSLIRV